MATRTASSLCTWMIVAVLAATGCVGDDGRPERNPDRRGTDHATSDDQADTSTDTTTAAPDEPVLATDSFVTPSRNIGCRYVDGLLRCDILSGLESEPQFPCPLDWTGMYLVATKYASPMCAGDTVFDEEGPVLEYGTSWSLAELTCDSESTGLTCTDSEGNGFSLARAGWTILGKDAAASDAFQRLRSMIRDRAQRRDDATVVVHVPELIGGKGCSGLQEAAVTVEYAVEPTPAVYFACYVSGRWLVASGPSYGE
jgi:hypothetical protein